MQNVTLREFFPTKSSSLVRKADSVWGRHTMRKSTPLGDCWEWTEGREPTCREREILADFLKEVMAHHIGVRQSRRRAEVRM